MLREQIKMALSQERWPQARELLARTVAMADRQLVQVLRSSSRQFLESHAAAYSTWQDLALAVALHARDATGEDRAQAYAIVQRRKGLETRALRLWKPGGDGVMLVETETRGVSDRGAKERRRLMLRLLFEGDQAAGEGHSEEDLRRLRREQELWERSRAGAAPRNRIEEEIAICSAEMARCGMDQRTAIVEYALFLEPLKRLTSPGNTAERYVAFVIRNGDEPPQLFDLGPAREIDEAVHELRTAVAELDSTEWRFGARFLYNRLIQPLQESLAGIERLRIAADGALTLLPFELLAQSPEVLLLDEFRVGYLLFGGEAWRLQQHFNRGGPPLVVAAPDFGGGDAAFFTPLEGALAEGVAIADKLAAGACITGADATEALLEFDAAPEILHIATHGFFFRTPPSALSPESYLARRASFRDPLERCGLAFAGANRFVQSADPPEESEDGLVFGAEIADMDLRATDLAVIAACRSAEGEVRAGDVANGLRRALKAAGARAVVCSLWDLPDDTTREMMEIFYDALLAGADRIDALHEARLRVRERMPNQPFFWGGLILDGDIGPLRRTQPGGDMKVGSVSAAGLSDEPDEPDEPPTQQQLGEQALARARRLKGDAAIAAFGSVIAMKDISRDVIHRARYFLAGMLRMSGDESKVRQALEEYALLLAAEDLAEELRIAAQFDRTTAHILLRDWNAALEQIDALLESRNVAIDHRAELLGKRAHVAASMSDLPGAAADLTAVIEMKGAPRSERAIALQNRARVRRATDDLAGAIADVELLLSLGDRSGVHAGADERIGEAREALAAGNRQRAIEEIDAILAALHP